MCSSGKSCAKLPRIEDAVKAGGFLCGNADDLIEHAGYFFSSAFDVYPFT